MACIFTCLDMCCVLQYVSPCCPSIVNGVTGRVMIVDRIRHATSDDLSTVEVSETDVIFHCVEVDRDEITDARTIVQ